MKLSKAYIRPTPNYVGKFQYRREEVLTVSSFAGGMNNVESDSEIEDNESTDCKNMMFSSNSLMEKRFGSSIYNDTLYPPIVDDNGNPLPITYIDIYKPITSRANNLVANGNINTTSIAPWVVSGSAKVSKAYSKSRYYSLRISQNSHVKQNVTLHEGHKYYFSAHFRRSSATEHSETERVDLTLDQDTILIAEFKTPNDAAWHHISKEFIAPASGSWELKISNLANDYTYVDDIILIDLTSTFGGGLEPSYEWCVDNLIYLNGVLPMVDREPVIVRATDTDFYIGNSKVCSVNGTVKGVNYMGKYYFVDGTSLYVYDGITYYKVCNSSSYTTNDTIANGTSIVVKSIPDYLDVTYPLYFTLGTQKVTLQITAIDRTTNTITVASGHDSIIPKETVVYFYIPLDTTHLEGTEVWDTTNHTVRYEACQNQLSDEFAGTPYIPDSPDCIVVHKDRIFIAGDSEQPHGVYMSALASISPVYFPSGAGIAVKPDGQKIIDLVIFDNALIIGRNSDMYVLYGDSEYQDISPRPFYLKQMDVSTGFMCSNCGSIINNFYIYLGYDGRFYRLNTPTTFVEYLMARPLPYKIDLYKAPFNLTSGTQLKTSTVSYYNEVWFNIGTDLVVVYNYDNMAWTYYTGLNGDSLYSDGITLYIGRHDGQLAKYDQNSNNYNDLGEPIDAKYETKRFDFGSSATFKYFTRFMVSSHAWESLTSYIAVSVEIDLYVFNVETLSSNMTKFGLAFWGLQPFNDKNLVKSNWRTLDIRGRTIKFKFSNNNNNEPFRIYDINIGYSLRDVR